MLLCVGAGIGTPLNLYMPGKVKEIRKMQRILEEDLRNVLFRMSEYIKKEDKSDYKGTCFDKLASDVSIGKKQALDYTNNTFFHIDGLGPLPSVEKEFFGQSYSRAD